MSVAASPPRRALFVAAIAAGSFLLFLVQPLVARLALPLLGGAPNVWNSAMVVFQALLLGGYAYAHALARLPLRRQAVIHLVLLVLALLMLPIGLPNLPAPAPGWEVLWVPTLFLLTIGPVFLLISAQASLLQNWYAASPAAGDPYALYAASNLGSFAGLLAYPLLLEPQLSLGAQSIAWTAGYVLVIGLVAASAGARGRNSKRQAADDGLQASSATAAAAATERGPEPRRFRRALLWVALAAVPSGLMLSTTTLLTTDLMAMPLLWVIPLGFYLLSFTVAFSESGEWSAILSRFAPELLLLVGGLAMVSGGQSNPIIAIAMIALLFILAVALHGRLFALRPGTEDLTFFYLMVAVGGVIGGIFTGLLAPVIFDWVYEHPILLLAAAILLPQRALLPVMERFWAGFRHRTILAGAIVIGAGALSYALSQAVEDARGEAILNLTLALVAAGIVVIGVRWAYATIFGLLMLGLGGIATLEASFLGDRTRSYFGIYNVELSDDGASRMLSHGTTLHGRQWLAPERRREPTSYYGPTSGAGLALRSAAPGANVGVVGLGVGTLACYRKPGQNWTFYEIDPQVYEYSRRGDFTFLSDCAPDARLVIGDARIQLAKEPAGLFDVLVIDAFSSDAIPLHLMTEEAFATYGRVLAEDGVAVIHISNRYIDLAPMIAALAQASGWEARLRQDREYDRDGQTESIWVAMAKDEEALDRIESNVDATWSELPAAAERAWTDDNASILPLLRW